MLPILGASSDMLNRQGFLPFGSLVHLQGAISRTTAPRDNYMLNIHGDLSTASYVRATLVLHDGDVSVKSLGTPAPYIGQMVSHAAPTGDPPSLRILYHPPRGGPRL